MNWIITSLGGMFWMAGLIALGTSYHSLINVVLCLGIGILGITIGAILE